MQEEGGHVDVAGGSDQIGVDGLQSQRSGGPRRREDGTIPSAPPQENQAQARRALAVHDAAGNVDAP